MAQLPHSPKVNSNSSSTNAKAPNATPTAIATSTSVPVVKATPSPIAAPKPSSSPVIPTATPKPVTATATPRTTSRPTPQLTPVPKTTPTPTPVGNNSVSFQLIQNGSVVGSLTISANNPTWSQTYTASQIGEYLIGPNIVWANQPLSISITDKYSFDFAGGTVVGGNTLNISGYSSNAGFVLGTPAGQPTGYYSGETLTVNYN